VGDKLRSIKPKESKTLEKTPQTLEPIKSLGPDASWDEFERTGSIQAALAFLRGMESPLVTELEPS
jgi:hypothetical protein